MALMSGGKTNDNGKNHALGDASGACQLVGRPGARCRPKQQQSDGWDHHIGKQREDWSWPFGTAGSSSGQHDKSQ